VLTEANELKRATIVLHYYSVAPCMSQYNYNDLCW